MDDFDRFIGDQYAFEIEPNVACSTPMTPIPLDHPSITPTVTAMEIPAPKRQRAISDIGPLSTCSFDAYDELDFQQVWDSLDADYQLLGNIQTCGETVNSDPDARAKRTRRPTQRKMMSSPKTKSLKVLVSTEKKSSNSISPAKVKTGAVAKGITLGKGKTRLLLSPPCITDIECPSRCSTYERRDKVSRYLEKRSRRVWKKEIKYRCRKQFAESRPRVAGRFIPKPATTHGNMTNTVSDMKESRNASAFRHDVISPMSASTVDSPPSSEFH